jgi:ATP-dependent DNA ligase
VLAGYREHKTSTSEEPLIGSPGTQSRWSAGKDLGFTALRPERVLEVKYDHMEGRRFRHTAHFKRWRADRDPESCGYSQLEEPSGYDLTRILSTDTGGES